MVVSYLFYLVNLKLVSRPMWISNCKQVCRQKLLNMDKTYDFVIKPLKYDPPENMVSINFFLETAIIITKIKIVSSKGLKTICHQLLSTMNILKQWSLKNKISKAQKIFEILFSVQKLFSYS